MLRKILGSVREYKKLSIATPILEAMEVAMECVIPFLIARLVNEIKAGCGMAVILRYGGLLALMALLSLLFGGLAGVSCARASCGLARNLRKDLFYSVQRFSFENIDRFLTSSLVTRMTTDVTNVQNAYMMLIRTAVRAPMMLIFAFAMAFIMGGRMAWIFLFVVPFLAVGLGWVIYKTMPLFRKVFKKYDRLNASIQENVKAMRVVKSFVREDYEQQKFDAAAEDVRADFTRAERMALEGIDLHIQSGETIGIIGGTGSSKSSLIQLISRLYDATEGSVKVGGRDVRDYDLDSLRNQVAVVLQKNILFSGTIKENLRWGNKDASDEELVQACKLACADEFITQFPDGYDTYIEQGGTNVSGGQKQRLCIARALLKKPKILILDDSTSVVDTRTDARIREAMRAYIPETTKIIIAQRTASVQDADHIIVMEGGRIDAIGTHAELMAGNDIYREIYTSQNKAGD